MNFNLTMLNLWIGMCRGVPGLPRELKNLGYSDKWIEYKFSNQDLETVHPELIISSDKLGHTLLLEFKSGQNTDNDQLRRYARITKNDLIRNAYLPATASEKHDIGILGKDEYKDRLCIGIKEGGYSFPLLLTSQEGITLAYNNFHISELYRVFSPLLKINWSRLSSRFVPLNSESELWELAEVVMPKVLHYMTERRPRVRIEDICQDICITWSMMGDPGRNEIRTKIREVLRQASASDFVQYLRWNKGADSLEIIVNPLDFGTDKRTAAYRKLRTIQNHLINKLKTGRTEMRQMQIEF